MTVAEGSPPLTRVLHAVLAAAEAVQGITPAHAGITWNTSYEITNPQDHPRSRGYYVPSFL